jgi:hypothetical protein
MTLDELVRETLTEKNRRLRQEKCKHKETYSQRCDGPSGSFASGFCWDCGKPWRSEVTPSVAKQRWRSRPR